jgi:hypothetical protein
MSTLPARKTTADERLQALARSATADTLIKYNSGTWLIADVAVPDGTEFILLPEQVTHSWTHFSDKKVADEITAIVVDDEDGDTELKRVRGKERNDLGHEDQTQWELDSSGKPKDPWSYGFGLPMTNRKTRALVVFRTASVGGMGAIGKEVAAYVSNKRLGHPIVTLSTGSYKNKKHGGYTNFPVFLNVGYEPPPAPATAVRDPNGGNGDGSHVIGASKVADREVDDMDDDIPF